MDKRECNKLIKQLGDYAKGHPKRAKIIAGEISERMRGVPISEILEHVEKRLK